MAGMRDLILHALGTDALAGELEPWSELFQGKWRLVDQFDESGQRYLVAERQQSGPSISPEDRRILVDRALGKPLKVIALELGFSESSVSRRLHRAMATLGVRTQTELARLLVAAAIASER